MAMCPIDGDGTPDTAVRQAARVHISLWFSYRLSNVMYLRVLGTVVVSDSPV